MFTIDRLGLSPSLCRCLSSTNLTQSRRSGLRSHPQRSPLPPRPAHAPALGRPCVPNDEDEFSEHSSPLGDPSILKPALEPSRNKNQATLMGQTA